MASEIKLSAKQKEVIKLMRSGYFLYENVITPGARWSLGKFKDNFKWGTVNGNVISKIMPLLERKAHNIAVYEWVLTTAGKGIKLD